MNKNCNNFCSISIAIVTSVGTLLLGIGTLLLGISAYRAVNKTDIVLEKILNIEKKADVLETLIKQYFAKQTVISSPLKDKKPTINQIKDALEKIPVSSSVCGSGNVYLPIENRNEVINELYEAQDPLQREQVLQKHFRYNLPNERECKK